jgi:hypothetical protein
MRTTIQIDDELLRQAKVVAAEGARTLSDVVADGLRVLLAVRARGEDRPRVRLPLPDKPLGILPGVDIDNSAALLELMEADDGPV